ncbi:MAG: hypothetical protein WAK40_08270 [Thermoplasmata archaeon]
MTDIDPATCQHPKDQRHAGSQIIEGERVRIETCALCGTVFVHPGDTGKILERRGPADAPRLNGAREVVLALLGAEPDAPMVNRLGVMKDAFLLEKESAPAVGIGLSSLHFVPYKQGPFSREVSDALDALDADGYLTVETFGRQQKFTLTAKGKAAAHQLMSRIGEKAAANLARKRRAWDQLGYLGILQKVYHEYPAYTSESEIADRIKPGGRRH